MPRLARLLTLPPRRWQGMAWAYWLLTKAYKRTRRGADITLLVARTKPGPGRPGGLTPEQKTTVSEAVWCIDTASRYPFPWATCLLRSLALSWWLESRGIGVELHIGVRKEGDQLTAHAWLERRGRVLNDRQYVAAVFASLEPIDEMRIQHAAPQGRQ